MADPTRIALAASAWQRARRALPRAVPQAFPKAFPQAKCQPRSLPNFDNTSFNDSLASILSRAGPQARRL
ncbi:hypothetical protein BCEN4_2120007 [Burkholderia cenocepacia]|nr:hypothetical protein BCEN4_2120007 [Burkholderia cenocepacia]